MIDGKAFGAEMTAIVKGYVDRATAPLEARIKDLEARPLPVDGKDGRDGTDGKHGSDGVGFRDALVDRDGVLVLTLSDGSLKNLGVVVGKDGAPGEKGDKGERGEAGERGDKGDAGADGNPGAPGENGVDGKDGRDGINGEKGKDGRDGFKLEDFDVRVLEDDRTVELSFETGEHKHIATLKWPVVIDRGVFKQGQVYQAGDAVTWGGSLWVAQCETDVKPDSADSGFRLAVKRGRDGKDAKAA